MMYRGTGDPREALAAWSRLADPGEAAAAILVRTMGAVDALGWLTGSGPGRATSPALRRAADRWRGRLEDINPRRDLQFLDEMGGRLIGPGDVDWPPGLADLGDSQPLCLWLVGALAQRGSGLSMSREGVGQGLPLAVADGIPHPLPHVTSNDQSDLAALCARAIAMVGTRACTAYGQQVTAQLVEDLVESGRVIVSGGAFGIDAQAHRSTLATGGITIAVMAGGLDQLYPKANEALLEQVAANGLLISEAPFGKRPRRESFLCRNRLIAALSSITVVIEAAWRSGAQNTARWAADIGHPVGAVPGPITAATSAGCHRLIREGAATCVTDAAEIIELADSIGAHLLIGEEVAAHDESAKSEEITLAEASIACSETQTFRQTPPRSTGKSSQSIEPADRLGLDSSAQHVLAALTRRGRATAQVRDRTGLATNVVLAALGNLETHNLCHRDETGLWCRR